MAGSLASLLCAVLMVSGAPARAEPQTRLDARLEHRVDDRRIGRQVAFMVLDESGQVIAAHDPDRGMQPASNMKLVTAIAAVAALGAGHRFPTMVLQGARPSDVIIQGSGDPLLTRSTLVQLAKATAAHFRRGARIVVHVDGDLFSPPSRSVGWIRGFIGHTVAGVQALAVFGDHARWSSRNAAATFTAALRSRGLRATLGRNQDATPDATLLARAQGHTVAQSIAVMLSRSDSSIAEVLFRHLALATGRRGTWAGAREAVLEVVTSLGVDPSGMRIDDGSGLSRDDRISTRFVASLLHVAAVQQPERFAAIFARNALPVAGRTGTLARSLGRYSTAPSRCAQGKVRAKTGTIFGTIALPGVAQTRERAAFGCSRLS